MKLATLALTSALIVLSSQAAEPTQTAATDKAMQSNTGQPAEAMQSNTGQPGETMQSDTGESTEAMQSSVSQPAGWIARSALTSAVEDREPVDSLNNLSNDSTSIYYFTEVRDMAGQTVTHRWEYGDQVMAEVEFEIGGPRWRVYSSKNLQPGWTGDWKVSVVDAAGNPLSVNTFVYTEAPAATSTSMPGDTSTSMPGDTSTGMPADTGSSTPQ